MLYQFRKDWTKEQLIEALKLVGLLCEDEAIERWSCYQWEFSEMCYNDTSPPCARFRAFSPAARYITLVLPDLIMDEIPESEE